MLGEGDTEKSTDSINNHDEVTAVSNNLDDNKASLTFINTNARSLCPKMSSLIDCFF